MQRLRRYTAPLFPSLILLTWSYACLGGEPSVIVTQAVGDVSGGPAVIPLPSPSAQESSAQEFRAPTAAMSNRPGATSATQRNPQQNTGVADPVAEDPFSERNFKADILTLPVDHLLGDWFGLLPRLEDDGVTLSVTFVSDLMGNPVGGLRQGFTEANNLGINALFDLEKRHGWEGASFLATMSQRSGNSLSNEYIGNTFSAQQLYGDPTFHVVDLAFQQKAWDDTLQIRLGRLAAADDFLVSSYTYQYVQGGIIGTPPGIFKNSPGMTGYPNATWGAVAKLQTTARTYAMGGLYNGDTSIRALDNHGLDFSMDGPLFSIVEVGYRHNQLPGDTGLVGNYKLGAWYDCNEFPDLATKSFSDAVPIPGIVAPASEGNFGFCALFDQVIQPFSAPQEEIFRGLGLVGSVVVSPDESKSQMPYYFATGVAARGIWASRPRDAAGFAFIFGQFSSDIRFGQRQAQQFNPAVVPQQREMALEWTYIFRFRNGAYFLQPDLQYILTPNGNEQIPDALVVGMQVGANF